jgi:hypothetical protein
MQGTFFGQNFGKTSSKLRGEISDKGGMIRGEIVPQ